MSILAEIIQHKKKEIEQRLREEDISLLRNKIRRQPIADFKRALVKPGIQVIAEIKRSSPSAGSINLQIDPVKTAKEYEANGAAAISVLTDSKYFSGSLDDLRNIKEAVKLPVLRKDFIISEFQIHESYQAGADAILLIAEALDKNDLEKLYRLATDLGLAVLLESHGIQQLNRVLHLRPEIVGINSRNLGTMTTDISHFKVAISNLPLSAVKVAESGIHNYEDLAIVAALGYDAALIGTALMGAPKPGIALQSLLTGIES